MDTVQRTDSISLLMALTPTEFAELFPKYYQRMLPDVGGFREALSKKSQKQQEEFQKDVDERLTRSISAGEKGIDNPVKAKEIYDYLRTKGIDHVHAVGIVNNINAESSLNSGAFNKNDVNGPSGGLFQHHDNYKSGLRRFSNMVSFVGEDWKTNWKKQIDFALTEKEMKDYLGTNYGDSSAASVGFTKTFENPANASSVSLKRLETIKTIERLSQEGGAPGTAASDQTASVSGQSFVGRSFKNSKGRTECVTYAQQAGGVGHTSGWTPGSSASAGSLKPGDWVATFGSGGKYTNTYGESHVARFESYIYDRNGNIIGMNVTHQYNRSGEVIPGQFFFGRGGEFDANKYHQIVDRGRPATMASSDALEGKILQREKFVKENPQHDDSNQVSKSESQKKQEAEKKKKDKSAENNYMPHPSQSSGRKQSTAVVNKPGDDVNEAKIIKTAFTMDKDQKSKSFDDFDREKLLAIIRMKESGSFDGNYSADLSKKKLRKPMTASGAYQFTNRDWTYVTDMVGYGKEYKRAVDAPKEVQDEVMYRKLKHYYEKFGSLEKAFKVHFTGNPKGYMNAAARQANPGVTPQKYLDEIQKFSDNYDKRKSMVAAKQTQKGDQALAAATTPVREKGPTTPANVPEAPKTGIEKVKEFASKVKKEIFTGGSTPSVASEVKAKPLETTPKQPTATVTPSTTTPTTGQKTLKLDPNAKGVQGASDGGSFRIPDGGINVYPLDKRDNMIAINPQTQQPLFTAKDNERMNYDPTRNRVDVTPTNKVDGAAITGTNFNMAEAFSELSNQLRQGMSNAGKSERVEPRDIRPTMDTSGRDMLNEVSGLTKDPFRNPSFHRAISRIGGQETGDGIDRNHYST